MALKICTKCGQEKEATTENFKTRKGKITSQCKECEKRYAKEWAEKNKDKCRAASRKWKANNKEKHQAYMEEYNKIYHKQYYKDNKEMLLEKQRDYREGNVEVQKHAQEYYQQNKEYILERNKKWIQNNPDKRREYNQSYKAKKRDLIADLTVEQWAFIQEYFNHNCAYCGKRRKLAQDHFIPVNDGGHYTATNIIPACKSCNSSKQDKAFEDWYPHQPFYSKLRERRILTFIEKDCKVMNK